MTGHNCPNCGAYVPCDKRNLGTGRQKPLTGYTANHKAVHYALWTKGWITPPVVRANLNHDYIQRKGKRTLWYDADVQTLLSDLVGWGYVEMRRMQGSKKFEYRWKAGRNTVTIRADPAALAPSASLSTGVITDFWGPKP